MAFALMRSLALATTLGLTLSLACEGKQPEDEPVGVKVLPAPSNGSPIAVEFLVFTGGGDRDVNIRLYNSGDKTAIGYYFLLRYYDADDELLKVKPGTSFESDVDLVSMSSHLFECEPKQSCVIAIDGILAHVPPEAVRAEILATQVRALASDGITIEDWWSQENWGEWPSP